ncbi:uncharacterized protein L969DRAFT_95388 [Mixia osmundae IAM 14324]|uniref:Importin-95 n=1 Tax=Mixia osmundae (strain CBS 9802 / IAM 14324 / JCM 22182 / KY 12970) TaxID=764103 RepID=G7DZ84_MIXOS|nr:uncharacterized protein L969DRAFT_95388 [Mixia osmundae IAM 14324]KEI38296.1 hypothetical protein L969DRAFT_95388 [Mixia osmundae IAM 14324]GAA95894.1 hypothetical protein E5Q_02552 [Mixia osmundae IAM 14324]
MSNVVELLSATLSADAAARENATSSLERLATESFGPYLDALSSALSSSATQSYLRNAAGLAIKNALSARDTSRQEDLALKWLATEPATRNKIKTDTLQTLASEDPVARNVAGQVVAAVAAIELPIGQWNDLIETMLQYVGHADNPGLRQATLQAIGYTCETIKPEVLALQSNQILTAVVQGARKEEPSTAVQLAAIHALFNSLEFVRENFEREGERNYIMQVVCEATQSTSSDIQISAFECLVRIMHLYYDKMKFYMERALFGLTILGMRHEDERVALQAVEFWSTVCDEEIQLALESQEAAEYEDVPLRECQYYAKIALPEILPVLLQLLTHQEEDATEDEWTVSMAAATCLALLAQSVGDGIVTPIIPFVENHIRSSNWRHREAAVMAFGSILDGPDITLLEPLVKEALPILIEMLQDPTDHVKDTTAWALAKITDALVSSIRPDEHLPRLISALLAGLNDSPRIVVNCCWAFMNLGEQLGDESAPSTTLSQYYETIVTALLTYTEKSSNENQCRTSAYEALSILSAHAPEDCVQVISGLTFTIIERSERLLSMADQILGQDDRNNYDELQSNFCAVLTSLVRRIGTDLKPMADRIMSLMLNLIRVSGKSSSILEDAFLCVGAMTSVLERDFQLYLPAFLPFLQTALNAHQEYQLCGVGVGLIGDICRALGETSLPYAQSFMEALLQDLQSTVLHRSVKPPILSCFGDIAMAVGAGFEPFLETTVNILLQAGATRADPSDYDLIEYINELREGILEAYTGIIGAMKTSGKADALVPYVPSILTFIHLAVTDQDRTDPVIRSSVGLLGDLAEAYPNGQIKNALLSEWVSELLKNARTRSGSADTKRTAKWAKEMVKRATQ